MYNITTMYKSMTYTVHLHYLKFLDLSHNIQLNHPVTPFSLLKEVVQELASKGEARIRQGANKILAPARTFDSDHHHCA